MITSLMCQAIDGLLAAAATALADTGAPVYDGVAAASLGDTPGRYLLIGTADLDADPFVAASAESQEFGAGFGQRTKREQATLYGVAVAWTGDTEPTVPKYLRDQCNELVSLLEAQLRANPQLGLAPALHWVNMSVLSVAVRAASDGLVVMIPFQVEFKARLEGLGTSG